MKTRINWFFRQNGFIGRTNSNETELSERGSFLIFDPIATDIR